MSVHAGSTSLVKLAAATPTLLRRFRLLESTSSGDTAVARLPACEYNVRLQSAAEQKSSRRLTSPSESCYAGLTAWANHLSASLCCPRGSEKEAQASVPLLQLLICFRSLSRATINDVWDDVVQSFLSVDSLSNGSLAAASAAQRPQRACLCLGHESAFEHPFLSTFPTASTYSLLFATGLVEDDFRWALGEGSAQGVGTAVLRDVCLLSDAWSSPRSVLGVRKSVEVNSGVRFRVLPYIVHDGWTSRDAAAVARLLSATPFEVR